jgi:hypothetical protein
MQRGNPENGGKWAENGVASFFSGLELGKMKRHHFPHFPPLFRRVCVSSP